MTSAATICWSTAGRDRRGLRLSLLVIDALPSTFDSYTIVLTAPQVREGCCVEDQFVDGGSGVDDLERLG
ncbi:MAG TPA: hypothetical protein VGX25_12470 [Actinophytocola sp.]|uniref:hypothetical protein n=1 Tax=Actinophytocola sp. TaxID=1872138 RepID=UPI002DDD9E7E|nr:hypothetical protein [Actinophytocola sp.]HEV2780198.1 hypothetical protein [Actinophytocola sp.]